MSEESTPTEPSIGREPSSEDWLPNIGEKTRAELFAVTDEYLSLRGDWVVEQLKVEQNQKPDRTQDLRGIIKDELGFLKADLPSIDVLQLAASEEGVLSPNDLVVTLVREKAKARLLAQEEQDKLRKG